jgi:hypothetical protein
MESVLRGTSWGVHPTRSIAADAAATFPVMKATRSVKVWWLMAPARQSSKNLASWIFCRLSSSGPQYQEDRVRPGRQAPYVPSLRPLA